MVNSLLNEDMRRINLLEEKTKEENEVSNPIDEVNLVKREDDQICCEKPGHVQRFCN